MRPRHGRVSARRGAATLVLIASGRAVACAPAPATPSAPATAAPARPALPASPAPSPSASPATAAAPAVATGPWVQPTGSVTMAIESEPASIVPKDACTNNGYFVLDNVYDSLTERGKDGKIIGELAESFSQVDPKTWRFKLRQGVKFHNGEPFTADAVVAVVSSIVDPVSPGQCNGQYNRGNYILLKASEDYWGTPRPTIAEVKIIPRNEAAVRASMLQAGEVQLAYLLTPEQATQAPASQLEVSGEVAAIRINTEHAVLKDPRVRQAMDIAIDRKGMIEALFGNVAEPLNGQYVRESSLGCDPDLKEYLYDSAKGKQLMQEAGAVGQSGDLIGRNGVFPRSDEVLGSCPTRSG